MALSDSLEKRWMVLIMNDDECLDTMYRFSRTSSLKEVVERWRADNNLSGDWALFSPDGKISYPDEFQTLEEIGESFPHSGIVSLRGQILQKKEWIEIFVYLDGQCQTVDVRYNDILSRKLPRLPRRQMVYEHEGKPLSLRQTVEQAGLKEKSVIRACEAPCRVAVTLSDGNTKSIRLPSGSKVCHLYDRVAAVERGDFSLTYSGRRLDFEDCVSELKRPVMVVRAFFSVCIGHDRFDWMAGSGEIKFTDFVFQLSEQVKKKVLGEKEFDRESLERMVFRCAGCGRRIWKSEEDYQLLQTNCCRQKSLTLIAENRSNDSGTNTPGGASRSTKLKKLVANKLQSCKVRTQSTNVAGKNIATQTASPTDKDRSLEVKLLVFYLKNQFKPKPTHDGFEFDGKYPWSPPYAKCHIKCHVRFSAVQDGRIDFRTFCSCLEPLFIGRAPIMRVVQQRGKVYGEWVVEVTSSDDDEAKSERKLQEFCNSNGSQFKYDEAKPEWSDVHNGKDVFIGSSERRTVVWIYNV